MRGSVKRQGYLMPRKFGFQTLSQAWTFCFAQRSPILHLLWAALIRLGNLPRSSPTSRKLQPTRFRLRSPVGPQCLCPYTGPRMVFLSAAISQPPKVPTKCCWDLPSNLNGQGPGGDD